MDGNVEVAGTQGQDASQQVWAQPLSELLNTLLRGSLESQAASLCEYIASMDVLQAPRKKIREAINELLEIALLPPEPDKIKLKGRSLAENIAKKYPDMSEFLEDIKLHIGNREDVKKVITDFEKKCAAEIQNKTRILKKTLSKAGEIESFDKWLAGEPAAPPDKKVLEAIQELAARSKVPQEKIDALHAIPCITWTARTGRASGPKGGANGIASNSTTLSDDSTTTEEMRLLDKLRLYPAGHSYRDSELIEVLQGNDGKPKTGSAAEYLECYIQAYYKEQTAEHVARIEAGVGETTLRHWRAQKCLPSRRLLNTIKEAGFFRSPDDYGSFKELVVANRHILMEFALRSEDNLQLSAHLSNMPASFAFEEIEAALRKKLDINEVRTRRDFSGEGELIITQGCFLHFLRHALDNNAEDINKNLQIIKEYTGINESVIGDIERDHINYESHKHAIGNKSIDKDGKETSIRLRLLKYYKQQLALKAANPKDPNCNDARTLLQMLEDKDVQHWYEALPMKREKSLHRLNEAATPASVPAR